MVVAPEGLNIRWEDDAKTLQSAVFLRPEVGKSGQGKFTPTPPGPFMQLAARRSDLIHVVRHTLALLHLEVLCDS